MKSVAVLAVLASSAAAQGLSPAASAVLSALNAISSATSDLDADIKAYNGGSDAELVAGLSPVLSAINDGNDAVAAGGDLVVTDATGLLTPLQDLATQVSTTVDDTVAQKSVFDANGLGYTILQSLKSILSATNTFISTTNSKLGPLSAAGPPLESPITDALSSGIAAFADETQGSGSGSGSASATAAPTGSTSSAPYPSTTTVTGTKKSTVTIKSTPSAYTPTSVPAFTGGAVPTAAAAYGAALLAGVGAVLAL